jgi:hypothetical protein
MCRYRHQVPVGDTHRWLVDHLGPGRKVFQHRHGLDGSLWRGRNLSEEEVVGFRRAWEQGLVELDDEGTVIVTRFYTVKRYQLYSSYDGGTTRPGRAWTWSWQEAFTQIAFAAELVVEHGWSAVQVALEVDRLDVAAGESPVTAPVLLAEAKLSDAGPGGLQPMLAVFQELAGGPVATTTAGVRANAVPKYEGLLRLQPRVFVAVAPGVRHAFDLTYRMDRVLLIPRRAGLARVALGS